RQVGVERGVAGVLGELLLVGLDPRVDARAAAAAAVEEIRQGAADPRRARPDAESDEADREHECEKDIRDLGVPAQAREEELVFPGLLPLLLRLRFRGPFSPRL